MNLSKSKKMSCLIVCLHQQIPTVLNVSLAHVTCLTTELKDLSTYYTIHYIKIVAMPIRTL